MNAQISNSREYWQRMKSQDELDPADWWKDISSQPGSTAVKSHKRTISNRALHLAAHEISKGCPDPFNFHPLLASYIAEDIGHFSHRGGDKTKTGIRGGSIIRARGVAKKPIPVFDQSFELIGKFDAVAERIDGESVVVRLTDEKGRLSYMTCERSRAFFKDLKEGTRFSMTFLDSGDSHTITCFAPETNAPVTPSRQQLVERRRRAERAIRGELSDY